MAGHPHIRAVCFDWGGTLMSEAGPEDIPMCDWPEVRCRQAPPSIPVPTVNYLPEFASLVKNAV